MALDLSDMHVPVVLVGMLKSSSNDSLSALQVLNSASMRLRRLCLFELTAHPV